MNKFLFNEKTMTTDGMVSVSQIQTFMSCPKKWEYGYIENLTPRVERPYLSIGKLCHTGMQVAMHSMWKDCQAGEDTSRECGLWKAWRVDGVQAMHEQWNEYVNSTPFLEEELHEQKCVLVDAVSVFTQAFEEFAPWKYEVYTIDDKPALELHFVVPCAGAKGLHGYIDAILVERDTGSVWCTDYKFRKQLSPDEEEITNVQNAVYTHACKKMGINITGTMTWQHINTPAATPSVNKNGTVSRAKIKTTWSRYAEFCNIVGQNPEAYREEMEPKLSDIVFHRATYENRNDIFVNNIWKQVIVPVAYAITSARNKRGHRRYLYPWNCKMCQFKDLCQSELRDHDSDFLRCTQFTTRPSVNRVIDTEDSEVV